jgi:crossover junction endodeoxyribonuclease RuvC
VPEIIDLPTTTRENGRTRIDGAALLDALTIRIDAGERTIIAVEHIHAMPVSGSIGIFSQGSVTGTIEGILDVLQQGRPYIETRTINPGTWKKHFGLIKKSKEDARQKAIAMFGSPAFLQRKKDHNRAEAALIATFVRDQIGYVRYGSLDQGAGNG